MSVVTSDGTKLVSCDESGGVKVWKVNSHTLVEEWTRPHAYPQVAISPDDRLIAIADKKVTIRHLDGGPDIKHFIKFRGKVDAMRFSPDGHKLACVISKSLYMFDVGTGKRIFNPLSRDNCGLGGVLVARWRKALLCLDR